MKDVSKNNMIANFKRLPKGFQACRDVLDEHASIAKYVAGLQDMFGIARTYGVTELDGHTIVIVFEKILDGGVYPFQKWWEVAYIMGIIILEERSSLQGKSVIDIKLIGISELCSKKHYSDILLKGSSLRSTTEWLSSKAIPGLSPALNGLFLPGNRYAMLQSGRS